MFVQHNVPAKMCHTWKYVTRGSRLLLSKYNLWLCIATTTPHAMIEWRDCNWNTLIPCWALCMTPSYLKLVLLLLTSDGQLLEILYYYAGQDRPNLAKATTTTMSERGGDGQINTKRRQSNSNMKRTFIHVVTHNEREKGKINIERTNLWPIKIPVQLS